MNNICWVSHPHSYVFHFIVHWTNDHEFFYASYRKCNQRMIKKTKIFVRIISTKSSPSKSKSKYIIWYLCNRWKINRDKHWAVHIGSLFVHTWSSYLFQCAKYILKFDGMFLRNKLHCPATTTTTKRINKKDIWIC